MSNQKFSMDEKEIERLETAHKKVRQSMTKEQLSVAEMVAQAFEEEKADFERRYMAEANLREWAEKLCGVKLDMSEIEQLKRSCAKNTGMFYFRAKRGLSVPLYKTVFGTVDRAESYLNVLEKTIVDITNSSQFTALGFRDLIKLAFNRLLKRSK